MGTMWTLVWSVLTTTHGDMLYILTRLATWCAMDVLFVSHVDGNFLAAIVVAQEDQFKWYFMKFLVHSKKILKPPHFVKSCKNSSALLSKILLMIDCTIGVEWFCPVACMFFNNVINSSSNFGLVSRIEKCFSIAMEAIPFSTTIFTCGLTTLFGWTTHAKTFYSTSHMDH